MSENSPIKVFITGACAGLAEVRQALSSHPDVDIVGTAVEPAKAQEKLAAPPARRSSCTARLAATACRPPTSRPIRQATAAPLMLVTSGNASGLLHEALAAGVADVVLLPQLTDALVFTIRKTTQLVHAPRLLPGRRPAADVRGQDHHRVLARRAASARPSSRAASPPSSPASASAARCCSTWTSSSATPRS